VSSRVSQFAGPWLDWAIAVSWQLALLVCLIAVLTYLLHGASPRLRYGLWSLVLVKTFLPPTLSVFWGVGHWGVAPIADLGRHASERAVKATADAGGLSQAIDGHLPRIGDESGAISLAALLFVVWAVGCVSLWLAVAWRYWRLMQTTNSMRHIDEGPARIEIERLADRFSVRTAPGLYSTEQAVSPMLIGVLHPKIVLPESILKKLGPEELQMVLAHELVHWRRRDTWVGWLQVFVQGLFWFHPLVWFANARIRHERECACDETVLREARCDRDGYGETIIRVLAAARGRSLVMGNMAGIFERGSRLQIRLEEIMNFDPTKRRFDWLSRAVLVVAALVLLPMAAPRVQAQRPGEPGVAAASEKSEKKLPKTNWPTIVSTSPKIGATDVDPATTEISVTFDRDMDVGGYSWTGGGEFYPKSPEGTTPVWKDKRTCVLPVQLKREAFYRVGINASSFQNFRSELGVPAETTAIYFATKGAKGGALNHVRVPKIVKSTPENGATDVDPRLGVLTVTFNMPMDAGFSWTGSGPTYPPTPEGEKPRWSADRKTCTLPVKLVPGTRYELGLNSFQHKNFSSKWGVPLEPVEFTFKTAGEAPAGSTAASDKDTKEGPPRIVKMIPKNGNKKVDPSLTEIKVTFDRPMAGGFSWTGGGEEFPTIPEGQKPRWSEDRMTATLPITLKPSASYRLGLNSPSFKNFASADGVPLEPVVYKFHTSPGSK
jgi:beta-lactamase regulating signal transducer with metallopeptidase domain